MYSPEKNQVAICLLKSNLEDIENELVAHRSAIPNLDAENDQKYRDSLKALRSTRYLNVEIENLRQENVRLVAKRMQLKRRSTEIGKMMDSARQCRQEMESSLQEEDSKIEFTVRKYEDSLRAKAERFRSTRGYYNEEEMRAEIGKVKETIAVLERELKSRQRTVDDKKMQLKSLVSAVPADLLDTVGKSKLEAVLKSLDGQLESLKAQKGKLAETQTEFAPLTLRN